MCMGTVSAEPIARPKGQYRRSERNLLCCRWSYDRQFVSEVGRQDSRTQGLAGTGCQVLKRWPEFRPLHVHSRRVFRHGLTLLETRRPRAAEPEPRRSRASRSRESTESRLQRGELLGPVRPTCLGMRDGFGQGGGSPRFVRTLQMEASESREKRQLWKILGDEL